MIKNIPISAYDAPPVKRGCTFTKIENKIRHDGLMDGFHTGGVWQRDDRDEVWKPLFAHANLETMYETHEDDILFNLRHVNFFPMNWKKVHDDRGFPYLVRPYAYHWHSRMVRCDYEVFEELERTMWDLANIGWEINDCLDIMYDGENREWFIPDLSIAQRWTNVSQNSNMKRMNLLWRSAGYSTIADLRQCASSIRSEYTFDRMDVTWTSAHVYISYNRPLGSWFRPDFEHELFFLDRLPDRLLKYSDNPWVRRAHTWVFTHELLTPEQTDKWELKLACYGTHFKHE